MHQLLNGKLFVSFSAHLYLLEKKEVHACYRVGVRK